MTKKKKFEPFGSRVLVRQAKGETVTEGGIVLPSAEEYNFGTVEAHGEDIKWVSVGDKVFFGDFAGQYLPL